MDNQETSVSLQELLKKKGIGPEGSKSLKNDELELATKHFLNPSVSIITKATFLTAILLLEPNEDERKWIQQVQDNPSYFLPVQLIPFLENDHTDPLIKLIRKLISGNDLDEAECRYCMNSLFDPQVPGYLKGPFLEGERLKRETFLENKIFLQSMWERSFRIQTSIPLLIDISDSYDGCTRTPNYSVFVAALLASGGFPTYVHSIDRVAPKEGITSHQILKAAGKNTFRPIKSVGEDLNNKDIFWGYVDQSVFFPSLYMLKEMRKEMVKRPFLATFEKLLQPIRAVEGNLIFTGYTHPHYRTELVKQLADQKQCSKALIVKGAEGSTQVSMSKITSGVFYDGNNIAEITFSPESFGFKTMDKNPSFLNPDDTVGEGLKALKGQRNEAFQNILYTASIVIASFNLMPLATAKPFLESLIDSGKALKHWELGCN